MQSTPIKRNASDCLSVSGGVATLTTPPNAGSGASGNGGGGNTSLDTGVSSDLSESRPSLNGDDESDSSGAASESGGEFEMVSPLSH